MSATFSSVNRILVSLILTLFFSLAASPASAYDWVIHFPAGSEYTKCEIIAYDSTPDFGKFYINRGETYTWHSGSNGANPLSSIEGRCQAASCGPTYFTEIKGRTCTGQDYTTSRMGGISCPNNVSVKICQKATGIGGWSHGFCPN